MSKRRPPAEPPAPRRLPHVLTCAALLAVAVVLSIVAAGQWQAAWERTPLMAMERVNWSVVREARARLQGTARDAYVAVLISSHITRSLHEPDRLPDLLEDARQGALRQQRSRVGRLQLATLALRDAEQRGTPPDQWWLRVEPYLAGLGRAEVGHHLPALVTSEAALAQRYGLPPGMALRLAQTTFGPRHGPFLQEFCRLTRALRAAERAAGRNEPAAQCERVVWHALREWLVADGPVEVKLIAADLLADELEQATPADERRAALAAGLRAWRQRYRDAAADLPLPPHGLRVDEQPVPDDDGRALARGLTYTAWTAGGATLLAVVALLTSPYWFAGGPVAGRGRRLGLLLTLVPALVVLLAGGHVVQNHPDWVATHMYRAADDDAGWPRLPLVAAAVALVAVLGTGALLARDGWRGRVRGVAVTAAVSWLLLAAAVIFLARGTQPLHDRYDAALDRSFTQRIAALASPAADGLLDRLRTWEP
jgi:hypothetical protein